MLKLVYTGAFLLFSYALLFFTSRDNDMVGKFETTGTVKTITDENGVSLTIVTPSNETLIPVYLNEDVILASGAKIRINYDTVGTKAGRTEVKIYSVTYLP